MTRRRTRVPARVADVTAPPSRRAAGGWIPDALLGALLCIGVAAVYGQLAGAAFVNYDDPDYITENPAVRAGLTLEGAHWALTSIAGGNWFPLTWLSHMLDVRLFGLWSGGHHLMSVAIHALSTLLLFGLLRRTTGQRWPSALVAWIFAVHPLHVESVAWLSERKDVLSGCFWLVTMWAYVRYVDRPGRARHAAVVIAFVLAAMSKAMVVTLPLVLLLLDVWPLRRWWPGEAGRLLPPRSLILEKAPLAVVAVAAAAVAFVAQQRAGAVASLDVTPIASRLGNAIVSYIVYVGQTVWPAKLSIFYPYPAALPLWQTAGAALILLGVSAAVFAQRRYVFGLVGWLWFLVTLLPVIGIVQIGAQAHADRYMYLPLIGLAVVFAWSAAASVDRRPDRKWPMRAAIGALCAALAVVSFLQVRHWRDTESLFRHAIDVTDGNYVAHNNLGLALREQNKPYEAIEHFREAVRVRPRYADAQINLGAALLGLGQPADALTPLAAAIAIDPALPEAHVDLGAAFNALGRPAEAVTAFREAIHLDRGNAAAHMGLSTALARVGRLDESAAESREAARLDPALATAHLSLGNELVGQGRLAEAAAEFALAVQLNADDVKARTNLGSTLATMGRYDEAIVQFTEVLRRDPSLTDVRRSLSVARELRSKRK